MSNSRFMSDRFAQRRRLRRVVALVYVAVMLAYLAWRTTIFNPASFGLSLTYFTAEMLGFVLGLVMIFCSWDYRHRTPLPAPPGLSVDVFVTTYREPVEIVRWTLIAAKELSYPHETWLLDDGNRPQMRALAAELGVRYLARGQNVDAKAGNLNYGLAHSTGDFVMVLDADHVVMPHALDVMLGFFGDGRIAMVQTPQDFYNVDAFQYFNSRRGGGLWNDQTFFYNIAEPCRDSVNGASCSGTGVVYRRRALDAIGGIPTETVTEDMHTSLKLHKAGFEVAFLNEPVAYGIAAADVREYYKTRHRWAHGNLHALRVENILFCRGLTLAQRLSYLSLGLIYLEGWQQLLLFTIPVVSLLAGWAPFEITVVNVLIVLLFPLVTTMLLQELGCGLTRAWVNEIFSSARFPLHLVAWLALFGRKKIAFRTSDKAVRGRVEWLLLAPQLTVMAVSLAALAFGVVSLINNFQIGPLAHAFVSISVGRLGDVDWNARLDQGYTLELVVVSGFWAAFNAAKVGYLVRKAIVDQKRQTEDYLFAVRQPLELRSGAWTANASAERLSWSRIGGRIYAGAAPEPGQILQGRLHLPAGAIDVEIALRAWSPATHRFEGDLVWRDAAARDRLSRALLSVDWHREFLHRTAYFTTPLEAIGRLLTWRRPFPPPAAAWVPVLYAQANAPAATQEFAVGSVSGDGRRVTLIVFRRIAPGTVLRLHMHGPEGIEATSVRIGGAEPLRSLGAAGLDGAAPQRVSGKIVHDGAIEQMQLTDIAAE